MGKAAKVAFQALALLGIVGTVGGPSPAVAPPPARIIRSGGEGSALSVMTYNVEGLPWPVRSGRADAARAIADRLRGMRAEGVQPHIVVLQEAFGAEQRAIGARAGYRYIVDGPDAGARPDGGAPTASDRAYVAGQPLLRGEGWGKWAGSGLVILSDYPIVATAATVFPDHACAGFDCLANKGAVVVRIAVPGMTTPLTVVATHMNAQGASGVGERRYTYAFRRQVDALGAFLRAHVPADAPFVVAGDTNIGRGPIRDRLFTAMLTRLPIGPGRNALAICLRNAACPVDARGDAQASDEKHKDLEVYGAGGGTMLRPVAVDVPFGAEADGSMLSDHIGYSVRYAVERRPTI